MIWLHFTTSMAVAVPLLCPAASVCAAVAAAWLDDELQARMVEIDPLCLEREAK